MLYGASSKSVTLRLLMSLCLWVSGISAETAKASKAHKPSHVEENVKMHSSIDVPVKKERKVVVSKHILSNGMTVLVHSVHTLPKVSIQLWYGVGSADETDSERGIAHLIEHMIFKGTQKLSESDINVITHMLSGSTNAFTSYDYTGYLFNFPTRHWHESLPIMADCMSNCAFKEDMLASEMKAVIQELKMYRDSYTRSLIEEMIGVIFSDHPYHHPIIGYKQDLWSMHSNDLKKFYAKHYIPNNATLVVVGDVEPQQVFDEAEKYFGKLKPNHNYKRVEHFFSKDLSSKSITLYRDIKQPMAMYAVVVPGIKEKKDHLIQLMEWIMGRGKSSRLYKKIVDELQLATSLRAYPYELFDYGVFFVTYEPKEPGFIPQIQQIIQQEFDAIARDGVTDVELIRAVKQAQKDRYDLFEENESQAYEIGKYFLATGDENYLFNYLNRPHDELKRDIKQLVHDYFRAPVTHYGLVLPLAQKDQELWIKAQEDSDAQDKRILEAHERTSEVEPPAYAKQVTVKEPGTFDFPKPETITLSNGLRVFFYNNENTPKIDLILDLRARHYYDPADKQGIIYFINKMLTEGTDEHPGRSFLEAAEGRGISIETTAGCIYVSLLADDLPFAIDLLMEMVTQAEFGDAEIERKREQLLVELKNFWDDPKTFSGQLMREKIYAGHPYSKNYLGTADTIRSFTRQDLLDNYDAFISPDGARLSIVGDLKKYDLKKLLEQKMGSWVGAKVKQIEFPPIKQIVAQEIDHPINRDQVVLIFARPSISRTNPDYDKLLLFDQIFGGGALGSMSSLLFDLREQSGLFYSIGGSLVSGSNEQPGMFMVKTLVSLDRLAEAEKRIKETIDTAVAGIKENELCEARHAILSAGLDCFSSNHAIAEAFLFLDKYKLGTDFFDKRANTLNAISLDEMKKAASAFVDSKNVITLRVGRVGDKTKKKSN